MDKFFLKYSSPAFTHVYAWGEVIHHPERSVLAMGLVSKSCRVTTVYKDGYVLHEKQAKQSLPKTKVANMALEELLFPKDPTSIGCSGRPSCCKAITVCHWQCGYPEEFLACLN